MEEIQDEHENPAKGESGEEDFCTIGTSNKAWTSSQVRRQGRGSSPNRNRSKQYVDADSRLSEGLLGILGKLVY